MLAEPGVEDVRRYRPGGWSRFKRLRHRARCAGAVGLPGQLVTLAEPDDALPVLARGAGKIRDVTVGELGERNVPMQRGERFHQPLVFRGTLGSSAGYANDSLFPLRTV